MSLQTLLFLVFLVVVLGRVDASARLLLSSTSSTDECVRDYDKDMNYFPPASRYYIITSTLH